MKNLIDVYLYLLSFSNFFSLDSKLHTEIILHQVECIALSEPSNNASSTRPRICFVSINLYSRLCIRLLFRPQQYLSHLLRLFRSREATLHALWFQG